jgi:hypothetical protein
VPILLTADRLASFAGCVMRQFDGYPGQGKCWYGLDVLPCNPEYVYTAKCNDDERQQWQFDLLDNSETLIRAVGTDQCLERDGVNVALRTCNSFLDTQRFFAIRGGLSEYRFELSMKTATRFCLNQAHHPKAGEVLAMYPCDRARSETTSWWELY